MRIVVAAVAASLLALTSPQGHTAEALVHSAAYGFTVAVPDFPKQTDSGVTVTPVMFTGPLHEGKGPACTVQIQNVGQTLSEFRAKFKALGITPESETPRKVSGRDASLFVSTGRGLKILSLAVPVGRSIYLVTCFAPVDQFATYEKTLRDVIDSFSVD